MPNLSKQTLTSNPLRWWGVTVYFSLSAMVLNYDTNKADDASVYGGIGKWPWVLWRIFSSVLQQCTLYIILSYQQLRQPKSHVLPALNNNQLDFITLLKNKPIQYKSYFTFAILSCVLTSCNIIYLAFQFNHDITDIAKIDAPIIKASTITLTIPCPMSLEDHFRIIILAIIP